MLVVGETSEHEEWGDGQQDRHRDDIEDRDDPRIARTPEHPEHGDEHGRATEGEVYRPFHDVLRRQRRPALEGDVSGGIDYLTDKYKYLHAHK